MITLPKEGILIQHIQDALDAVAERHEQLHNADWFPEIASEIAARFKSLGLKCYARGKRRSEPAKDCVGSEWLFDFCALIYDEAVEPEDRFMAQAAVVGEIEWATNDIDHDFEKLMIGDSLVCFMVFQQFSGEDAEAELARLGRAVERRQGYARQRGMTRPPAFLLSGYVDPEHRFVHRHMSGA